MPVAKQIESSGSKRGSRRLPDLKELTSDLEEPTSGLPHSTDAAAPDETTIEMVCLRSLAAPPHHPAITYLPCTAPILLSHTLFSLHNTLPCAAALWLHHAICATQYVVNL